MTLSWVSPMFDRPGRSGSVLLAALAALLLASSLEAQSWRTLTSTRQEQGERQLAVQVEYAAGTLELSQASRSQLYNFELRYDEDLLLPVAEYLRKRAPCGSACRGGMASGSR